MEKDFQKEELRRSKLNPVLNCPICGEKGVVDLNNKLVLKHMIEEKPKYFVQHKWSILSGRIFTKKVSDEDELW